MLDAPDSLSDLPTDWSADGRRIVLQRTMTHSTRGWDIWLMSADGHEARPLLEGASESAFSPDGRWLAYVSTEAGSPNVYIRPLEDDGSPRRISPEGGSFPRWRRDGGELFYLSLTGQLTAVPVQSRASLETGAARALFTLVVPAALPVSWWYPYDVSPDGQRFLIAVPSRETRTLTLVQNWAAGRSRRN
jgi:hypothetical protein